MKKSILLSALALSVLFAGCKAKTETYTDAGNSELSEIVRPAAKTVYGEVFKTVGNQFTVKVLYGEFDPQKLAEQQNSPSQSGGGNASFEAGASRGGNRPFGGNSAPADSSAPAGSAVPNFSRPPAQTDENGSRVTQPRETDESGNPVNFTPRNRGNTYTGEELDIIVPIGTPVTTYVFKDGTYTEKESDIADIKNGSVIYIEYSDEETVSKVHIVPATRSNRQNTQNGQGFNPEDLPRDVRNQIADAQAGGPPVLIQQDQNGNIYAERQEAPLQGGGNGIGG